MFLKPIIYTPLSILFHIVTFVFRIVGGIASVAMIYGFIVVIRLLLHGEPEKRFPGI